MPQIATNTAFSEWTAGLYFSHVCSHLQIVHEFVFVTLSIDSYCEGEHLFSELVKNEVPMKNKSLH